MPPSLELRGFPNWTEVEDLQAVIELTGNHKAADVTLKADPLDPKWSVAVVSGQRCRRGLRGSEAQRL